jgi:class 3 adenylate cyclase
MAEGESLFAVLRRSADADAASAIETLVQEGRDADLCRVNVVDFAARNGLGEDQTIAAFLHASRLGIFDMAWNVLCPGCGGVLSSNGSLKTMDRAQYNCALCATDYEATLDDVVEVTFTVDPRVRKIAGHDPQSLPLVDYFRQIFWGSGFDIPEDVERRLDDVLLDSMELPAGERATMSFQLPAAFVIVFDPVTHSTQFIETQGEPTRERQTLSFVLNTLRAPNETVVLRPGPLRLTLENRTQERTLPGLWIANDALHDLLSRRRPFLTAKRLLTNQTFRDLYRTDAFDQNQRFKITSLTFLFTDLKGSTALYDRVGDLVAFDLVNAHFGLLADIVAAESGAVVKTIGDAVMATFPTPDRAVAAALRMREAMQRLSLDHDGVEFTLKIGIHEGPCLAVMLNDRQDYFGQTVNIASRIQNLAVSRSIFATASVVAHPGSQQIISEAGLTPIAQNLPLRGVAQEMQFFEIP